MYNHSNVHDKPYPDQVKCPQDDGMCKPFERSLLKMSNDRKPRTSIQFKHNQRGFEDKVFL